MILQTQGLGNGIEELFNCSRANLLQHLGAFLGRVGDVTQCYSLSAFVKSSYSAGVSKLSTSPGLLILILIIQPSPYGSFFTFSGSSFSAPLTSETLPETAVTISDTASTNPTHPTHSPAATSS